MPEVAIQLADNVDAFNSLIVNIFIVTDRQMSIWASLLHRVRVVYSPIGVTPTSRKDLAGAWMGPPSLVPWSNRIRLLRCLASMDASRDGSAEE